MAELTLARLLLRIGIRIGLIVCVILVAGQLVELIKQYLQFDIGSSNEVAVRRGIALGILAYVVFTAVPFVPGTEIGMVMLGMFGAAIAPLIYLSTIASLCLAYAVGRLVPPRMTAAGLRWLGLHRLADRILATLQMTPPERLDMLLEGVDSRILRVFVKHRYVALALIINMPGSMIVGGGGGISMAAGMSGVFAPVPFLLTVMIAVSPVPIAIMMFGT